MNHLRTLIVSVTTLVGLVAAVAASPAALAQVVAPYPGGSTAGLTDPPAARVVHTGMPAWQIALVAVGAALLAAALTAALDRTALIQRSRPSTA